MQVRPYKFGGFFGVVVVHCLVTFAPNECFELTKCGASKCNLVFVHRLTTTGLKKVSSSLDVIRS